jgi:hypothetical protein
MSVYVDAASNAYGRMKMCHMMADTKDELHAMAARIGIQRKWFQDRPAGWHYDICQSKRVLAVELGAVQVDSRKLVEIVRKQRESL